MALVLGTSSGFVKTAPSGDPTAGSSAVIDGASVVTKHTAPAGATKITEIGWYRTAGTNASNFEIALYNESGGVANARLFVDATNSSTSTGWIVTAVDWNITPGTAYWLALQMDAHSGSSNVGIETSGGAGYDRMTSQTTLNDPYGGGAVSDADGMAAIYALVNVRDSSAADTTNVSDVPTVSDPYPPVDRNIDKSDTAYVKDVPTVSDPYPPIDRDVNKYDNISISDVPTLKISDINILPGGGDDTVGRTGYANAETNDLTQFNAYSNEAPSAIPPTVSSSVKAHGTYGYKATFDGTATAIFGELFIDGTSDFYARFYVYIPSGQDWGVTDGEPAGILIQSVTDSWGTPMSIMFCTDNTPGNEGVPNRWRIQTYSSTPPTGSYDDFTTGFALDTWICIEMRAVLNGASSGGEIWINGTKIDTRLDCNHTGADWNRIRFGYDGGAAPANGVLFYFDDCVVDTSYIGLYPETQAVVNSATVSDVPTVSIVSIINTSETTYVKDTPSTSIPILIPYFIDETGGVFFEGWEDGNYTGWTLVHNGDNDGTVFTTVVGGEKIIGTSCLEFHNTTNFYYGEHLWANFTSQSECYVRFYFKASGDYLYTFDARQYGLVELFSTNKGTSICSVDLFRDTGGIAKLVFYDGSANHEISPASWNPTTAPMYIEIHYKKGTGANAVLECWYNGELKYSGSNHNDTVDAGSVELSLPSAENQLAESWWWFDNIKVANSYIGSYSPNSIYENTAISDVPTVAIESNDLTINVHEDINISDTVTSSLLILIPQFIPESAGIAVVNAETGDTSQFNNVYTANGATFIATSDSALHGYYGFKGTFDGTTGENNCYGNKELGTQAEVYARCYIYLSSNFQAAANSGTEVFWLWGSGTHVCGINLDFDGSGLPYSWFMSYEGGGWTGSTNNLPIGQWIQLEIYYKKGTGSNSIHRVWINNSLVLDISNGTSTRDLDNCTVGLTDADNVLSGRYFYLDSVAISTTKIGDYVPSAIYQNINVTDVPTVTQVITLSIDVYDTAFCSEQTTRIRWQTLTTANAVDMDDMCIWIHPTDTSLSTIICSDKTASRIFVFGLDGTLVQDFTTPGVCGNIDVRYNFYLNGSYVDYVAVNDRTNSTILFYTVDSGTRQLTYKNNFSDGGDIGTQNYGLTLYKSPVSGKHYVYLTGYEGKVKQWELYDNSGNFGGTYKRSWQVGTGLLPQTAEGMCADDVLGYVYVAEEDVGVHKYDAEPEGSTSGTNVSVVGENGIVADQEGVAIYYQNDNTGYVVISNQGANNQAVFTRETPHTFVKVFTTPMVSDGDGLDVTNVNLGANYPTGLMAVHQGGNSVILVPWDALALDIDTQYNPTKITNLYINVYSKTNVSENITASAEQTVLSLNVYENIFVADIEDFYPDTAFVSESITVSLEIAGDLIVNLYDVVSILDVPAFNFPIFIPPGIGIEITGSLGNANESLSEFTAGTSNLSISASAKNHGTYGFLCSYTGSAKACIGGMTFSARTTDTYARFYIYIPSGYAFPASSSFKIIDSERLAIQVDTDGDGVPYQWRLVTSSGYINSATNFSLNEWHCIETEWVRGTGSNGGGQLWVDGDLVLSKLDSDETGSSTTYFYFGVVSSINPDNGTYVYFDDVVVHNSYIGTYPDPAITDVSYVSESVTVSIETINELNIDIHDDISTSETITSSFTIEVGKSYVGTQNNSSGSTAGSTDPLPFGDANYVKVGNSITPSTTRYMGGAGLWVTTIDGDLSNIWFISEVWTRDGSYNLVSLIATSEPKYGLTTGWNVFTYSQQVTLTGSTDYVVLFRRVDNSYSGSNKARLPYAYVDWTTGEGASSVAWTASGTAYQNWPAEWAIRLYAFGAGTLNDKTNVSDTAQSNLPILIPQFVPESGGIVVANAETGNTSQFTGIATMGATFTATSEAKLHGTYGFKALFDGTSGDNHGAGYFEFADENEIYARIYFYIDSALRTNNPITILQIRSNYSTQTQLLVNQDGGGVPYQFGWNYSGGGWFNDSGTYFSLNTWHCLEMRTVKGTGSNSIHQIWIDNNLVLDVSNGTTTTGLDAVFVGAFPGYNIQNGGFYYIDSAKVSTSRIGEYVPSAIYENITVSDISTVSIEVEGEYNVNVYDNIAISQTSTTTLTGDLLISVNDKVGISETVITALSGDLLISVNDKVGISETVTTALSGALLISVNDKVGISEDLTVSAQVEGEYSGSVYDKTTISESVTIQTDSLSISVSDKINVSENITTSLLLEISIYENSTVASSVHKLGQELILSSDDRDFEGASTNWIGYSGSGLSSTKQHSGSKSFYMVESEGAKAEIVPPNFIVPSSGKILISVWINTDNTFDINPGSLTAQYGTIAGEGGYQTVHFSSTANTWHLISGIFDVYQNGYYLNRLRVEIEFEYGNGYIDDVSIKPVIFTVELTTEVNTYDNIVTVDVLTLSEELNINKYENVAVSENITTVLAGDLLRSVYDKTNVYETVTTNLTGDLLLSVYDKTNIFETVITDLIGDLLISVNDKTGVSETVTTNLTGDLLISVYDKTGVSEIITVQLVGGYEAVPFDKAGVSETVTTALTGDLLISVYDKTSPSENVNSQVGINIDNVFDSIILTETFGNMSRDPNLDHPNQWYITYFSNPPYFSNNEIVFIGDILSQVTQNDLLEINHYYKLSFEISEYTSDDLYVFIGATQFGPFTSTGSFEVSAVYSGGSNIISFAGNLIGKVTNIKLIGDYIYEEISISSFEKTIITENVTLIPQLLVDVHEDTVVSETVTTSLTGDILLSVYDKTGVSEIITVQLVGGYEAVPFETIGISETITTALTGDLLISVYDKTNASETVNVNRASQVSIYDKTNVSDSGTVIRRAAWFNPDQIVIISGLGSIQSGTIEDTWSENNQDLVLTEVAGSPGFEYNFYFYDVPIGPFNSVHLVGYYSGNLAHVVSIRQYNFDTTNWVEVGIYQASASETTQEIPLNSTSSYVSNGEVRIKFIHTSPGNPTHRLYFDEIRLDLHEAVFEFDTISISENITGRISDITNLNSTDLIGISEDVNVQLLGGYESSPEDTSYISEFITVYITNVGDTSIQDKTVVIDIPTVETVTSVSVYDRTRVTDTTTVEPILSISVYDRTTILDVLTFVLGLTSSSSQDKTVVIDIPTVETVTSVSVYDRTRVTDTTTVEPILSISVYDRTVISDVPTGQVANLGDISVYDKIGISETVTVQTLGGFETAPADTVGISENISVFIVNLGDISVYDRTNVSDNLLISELLEINTNDKLQLSEVINVAQDCSINTTQTVYVADGRKNLIPYQASHFDDSSGINYWESSLTIRTWNAGGWMDISKADGGYLMIFNVTFLPWQQPNTPYTFRFRAKSNGYTDKIRLWIGSNSYLINKNISTNWEEFRVDFTYPSGDNTLRLQTEVVVGAGVIISLDDIYLEPRAGLDVEITTSINIYQGLTISDVPTGQVANLGDISVYDKIGISETVTVQTLGGYEAAPEDTSYISENITVFIANLGNIAVYDPIFIKDYFAGYTEVTLTINIYDSLFVSDVVNSEQLISIVVNDRLSLSESVLQQLEVYINVNDKIQLAEIQTSNILTSLDLYDTTFIQDYGLIDVQEATAISINIFDNLLVSELLNQLGFLSDIIVNDTSISSDSITFSILSFIDVVDLSVLSDTANINEVVDVNIYDRLIVISEPEFQSSDFSLEISDYVQLYDIVYNAYVVIPEQAETVSRRSIITTKLALNSPITTQISMLSIIKKNYINNSNIGD